MTDPAAPDLAIVKLKPCPFCETAMHRHEHCFSHPRPNGPDCIIRHYSFANEHTKRWNTRADSPEAAQCIEMLVGALKNLLECAGRRRPDGHYKFMLVPNRDVEAARAALAKVRGR